MTRGRSFAGSAFSRAIYLESEIPPGNASAVALAVAASVNWGNFRAEPSVKAIADRVGVSTDYVKDCIELMVLLGYLIPAGINERRRAVYTPALPANPDRISKPLASTSSRQPIDNDNADNAEAA